jgi:hypothetical protein
MAKRPKRKKPTMWWERRDMTQRMQDKRVPGGLIRLVKTDHKVVHMFIPDDAFKLDPVDWEGFMGINQILVRFLARKFPELDNRTQAARALAASMAAWGDTATSIAHLEREIDKAKKENRDLGNSELQLEMLDTINEVFGDRITLDDVRTQQDVREIILEMWDQAPPAIIPSEYMDLSTRERAKAIDHVMEYTMYLHENFKDIHPMERAEVATMCAQHTAKHMLKHATDEVKPMVEALIKRYESN